MYRLMLWILLLIPAAFFSQNIPGTALWYSGFNAGISGQGFAGVAGKNSGFYSLVNPASIATLTDIRLFSTGTVESPNFGSMVGISSPIAPGGNLYVATEFLSYDGSALTRMGYGKKVRSDLYFGLEGIITFHTDSELHTGGGISAGVLWHPKDPIPFDQGWGFKNFSFGSVLKLVFYPHGGVSMNSFPELMLKNGFEATFMDIKSVQWKLIMDFAIGAVPLPIQGSHFITWGAIGTTFSFWNVLDLSMGTILGTFNMVFGVNPILPFTFGLRLGYEWESFVLRAHYNFGGHQFNQIQEYRHTLGLEMGFGKRGKRPPIPELTLNNKQNLIYFSPNQSTVTLKGSASDKIDAWKLTIEDENNKIIRLYEGEKTPFDKKYTVGTFFYNYFAYNTSELIPETIIWNGKTELEQGIPDGIYQATLNIRYEEDKYISSKTNIIIIDTKAPYGTITPSVKTLYLGDNSREELHFIQDLSPDAWDVKLIDQSDQSQIAKWSWNENQVPLTNTWRLQNPLRMNVATGQYSYIATSYDRASNYTQIIVSNINIETKSRKPKISSDERFFSPNKDDHFDFMKIYPDYQAILGLEEARLLIYTSKGDIVYRYDLDINELPPLIIWNGRDNSGKILKDDTYFAVLEAIYDDKKTFHSNPLPIDLDTSPPTFTLEYYPKRFSPDKDGTNDILHLDLKSKDLSGIAKWSLQLLDSNDTVLKEYFSTDADKLMTWNPPRASLFTGDIIQLRLKMEDVVQNSIDYKIADIRIDTLLDPYDKNLIIMKDYVFFEPGSGILSGQIYPYLDQIWEAIKYGKTDTVNILARAYHSEAQNSEYEAYRLAILRGEAIKAYLIQKGFPKENVNVKIETANETTAIKQKDFRRVKIYLEKDFSTLK